MNCRVRNDSLTPYEEHCLAKFFSANGGNKEKVDVAKLIQFYGKAKGAGSACRRLGMFLVEKYQWSKGQVGDPHHIMS